MPELFSNNVFSLIANLMILAVIIIVALYVLFRFRSCSVQQEQSEISPAEYLNYFQELKTEGKLSDEEFRLIKKRISAGIVRRHFTAEELNAVLSAGDDNAKFVLERLLAESQSRRDGGLEDEGQSEETQFARRDNGDTVIEKKDGQNP